MKKRPEQIKAPQNNTSTNVRRTHGFATQKITGRKSKPLPSKLSSEQQDLVDMIHEWAYTDSQKHPKRFAALFNKIWAHKFRERQ